jgi:sugar phosphate isomerase/epimerase
MPRAGTYIRASDFAASDFVPEAPPDWPATRQERLRRIVASRPAGWWTPGNEGLLHEYVCALEMAETLQRLLDRLDSEGVDVAAHVGEIGHLLTARDREAKAALRLARAMRLTPLSLPPRREGRDSPTDESLAPWSA